MSRRPRRRLTRFRQGRGLAPAQARVAAHVHPAAVARVDCRSDRFQLPYGQEGALLVGHAGEGDALARVPRQVLPLDRRLQELAQEPVGLAGPGRRESAAQLRDPALHRLLRHPVERHGPEGRQDVDAEEDPLAVQCRGAQSDLRGHPLLGEGRDGNLATSRIDPGLSLLVQLDGRGESVGVDLPPERLRALAARWVAIADAPGLGTLRALVDGGHQLACASACSCSQRSTSLRRKRT